MLSGRESHRRDRSASDGRRRCACRSRCGRRGRSLCPGFVPEGQDMHAWRCRSIVGTSSRLHAFGLILRDFSENWQRDGGESRSRSQCPGFGQSLAFCTAGPRKIGLACIGTPHFCTMCGLLVVPRWWRRSGMMVAVRMWCGLRCRIGSRTERSQVRTLRKA